MTTAQQVVLAVAGVLAGFAIGSFACVVIERMPVELDEPNEFGDRFRIRPWREVLGGSSRCSGCGSEIRPWDKIPFVSWLMLRGKCRTCGDKIPAFHPLVEFAVPAIGLAMAVAVGWGWRVGPVLWLVPVGVVASAIDLRTLMVPTRLVWPAFGVAIVLSVVGALAAHEQRWLFGGAIGALLFAGPLFLIWFAVPRAMGFGDIRLSVLLGWTLGFAVIDGSWRSVAGVVLVLWGTSAVIGILIALLGFAVRGRGEQVPFGPALVAGTFLCIAFAPNILTHLNVG